MREYKIQCNENYEIANTVNIERRYLLNRELLLDDPDNEIPTNMDQFFCSADPNVKYFNIKSPYDTGTTQLLKRL